MTDDDKALVDELRINDTEIYLPLLGKAADRIEALSAENERLRLDLDAQEALQVSAYHAGLKAGWNFCVDDDHDGYQAAMGSTDHIKELARIRTARAALGEQQ